MTSDPVSKVDRDLGEIIDLHAKLLTQAVRDGAHRLMPGGHAMVALANVANMEAWENQQQATERYEQAYTSVEDEDPDDAWSPFQLLEFWSEQWRREHGAEYGRRPTITTEASFLRWCLNWAWENESAWDDFARDVNRARLKLENILTDGHRVERTRVQCDATDCLDRQTERGIEQPKARNLIRLVDVRGREDVWKCPGCRERFDEHGFKRATVRQMHHERAERFVPLPDAISTLISQGRGERTVRRWLAPNVADQESVVQGYCEVTTRRVFVFWPDLWRRHLATRKTPRASV